MRPARSLLGRLNQPRAPSRTGSLLKPNGNSHDPPPSVHSMPVARHRADAGRRLRLRHRSSRTGRRLVALPRPHGHLRRSPPCRGAHVKRSQPPRRRAPLRPVSPRRESERASRTRIRTLALIRDGGCIAPARVPEVHCWGPLDCDEWRPRGEGGSHLDLDNVQVLCRAHHDWKHAHPIEAAHRGLRPYPAGYTGPRPAQTAPD